MSAWSERVDALLFDGETVETEHGVGSSDVVVTSHRVLAFTPQQDGKDYRTVDRPNVRGVSRQHVDTIDVRRRAAKLGVGGAVLAGIGFVFDPESLFPRPDLSAAGGAGDVGGVVSLVQGMLELFYALDTGLLVLGGLLLAVATALVAIQLGLRSQRLAIEVAGEEPLLLPGKVADVELEQLRTAVTSLPEPGAGDGGRASADDDGGRASANDDGDAQPIDSDARDTDRDVRERATDAPGSSSSSPRDSDVDGRVDTV